MGTHKVHLAIFDICSIGYSTNVNWTFEFFSCNRNCDLSTLVMACETRCRRDCGIRVWYTWAFTYPRWWKWYGVISGGLGGQGMGCASPIPVHCHFIYMVIGTPLATDMLQFVLLTKTKWVSFLFSSCFILPFVNVSKRHQFIITQNIYTSPVYKTPLVCSGITWHSFQQKKYPCLPILGALYTHKLPPYLTN
jgi:hypothetical protein